MTIKIICSSPGARWAPQSSIHTRRRCSRRSARHRGHKTRLRRWLWQICTTRLQSVSSACARPPMPCRRPWWGGDKHKSPSVACKRGAGDARTAHGQRLQPRPRPRDQCRVWHLEQRLNYGCFFVLVAQLWLCLPSHGTPTFPPFSACRRQPLLPFNSFPFAPPSPPLLKFSRDPPSFKTRRPPNILADVLTL
jgi:hypothetical protein